MAAEDSCLTGLDPRVRRVDLIVGIAGRRRCHARRSDDCQKEERQPFDERIPRGCIARRDATDLFFARPRLFSSAALDADGGFSER